jgi:tetratricopeptide (TPR) repeat protein
MKWLNTIGERRQAFVSETDERLDAALEGLTQAALKVTPQVFKERAGAPARFSELLTLPHHARDSIVASEAGFQTYALAVVALKHTEKTISSDPREAIELAQLAGAIAAHVLPKTCGGTAALADLQAYALAMEGNAWRVSGDLQKALETFTVARQLQERGRADTDLMARVDRLEASLRRDLRQLDTSLALLDRAARLFKSIKAEHQLARTIINQSHVFYIKRDFDQAAELLEHARALSREPFLVLCINHNLIDILARSGKPGEAARLFEQVHHLYFEFSDPLMASRRLWLEGVIARELGENLEKAGELLTEVTSRLASLGYSQDATLARFDLALLQAKKRLTRPSGTPEIHCGIAQPLI